MIQYLQTCRFQLVCQSWRAYVTKSSGCGSKLLIHFLVLLISYHQLYSVHFWCMHLLTILYIIHSSLLLTVLIHSSRTCNLAAFRCPVRFEGINSYVKNIIWREHPVLWTCALSLKDSNSGITGAFFVSSNLPCLLVVVIVWNYFTSLSHFTDSSYYHNRILSGECSVFTGGIMSKLVPVGLARCPNFMHSSPPLREPLKHPVDWLFGKQILTLMPSSAWVTPIIAVFKKYGSTWVFAATIELLWINFSSYQVAAQWNVNMSIITFVNRESSSGFNSRFILTNTFWWSITWVEYINTPRRLFEHNHFI